MRNLIFIILLAVVLPSPSLPQNPALPQSPPKPEQPEINTALMESTFEIQSVPTPGKPVSSGTSFIIGRPLIKQPDRSRYVLITAAHVLSAIDGDMAILNLRKQTPSGEWQKTPYPIQIRINGRQQWIAHPSADVAVMYVALPNEIPLVTTGLLADDEMLKKFEVHPGDTLLCLGFPFARESSIGGFPILRSGRIASFPLTPTAQTKTFLFDFSVFEGNSGGPVYLVDQGRLYGHQFHLGESVGIIMGLVSEAASQNEQLTGLYSAEVRRIPLNLAVVVHASFIKEAIDMLPPPDDIPQAAH